MESEVEQNRVTVEQAIKKVIEFSLTNFNLQLSEEQLENKIS